MTHVVHLITFNVCRTGVSFFWSYSMLPEVLLSKDVSQFKSCILCGPYLKGYANFFFVGELCPSPSCYCMHSQKNGICPLVTNSERRQITKRKKKKKVGVCLWRPNESQQQWRLSNLEGSSRCIQQMRSSSPCCWSCSLTSANSFCMIAWYVLENNWLFIYFIFNNGLLGYIFHADVWYLNNLIWILGTLSSSSIFWSKVIFNLVVKPEGL